MNEPANLDAARMRRQAKALENVASAKSAVEEAGKNLRAAIVQAVDDGATYAEAGRAAGITRGRVYQIVHEERKLRSKKGEQS